MPKLTLKEREIAVIQIKPRRMLENTALWMTRFDSFFPTHVSPAQLEALGVELITVRAELQDRQLGQAVDENRLRFSVVAKLSESLELDEFFQRWRTAPVASVSKLAPDIVPSEGGYSMARIPAGTFLAPVVRTGTLHFEDVSGKRLERGINVGKIDPYYQFVEGGDGDRAVFHFSGIAEEELSVGKLAFRLLCSRFNTGALPDEPLTLRVQLRNVSTQVVSEAVLIETMPMQEFPFTISDTLSLDQNSETSTIVFRDFIKDGKVDVLMSHDKPGLYLGVGQNSLRMDHHQDEYVALVDKSVFVAPTNKQLNELVAGHREETPSADLHCSLDLETLTKRHALAWLLKVESGFDLTIHDLSPFSALDIQADFQPSIKVRATLTPSKWFTDWDREKFTSQVASWWVDCSGKASVAINTMETMSRLKKGATEGVLPDFPIGNRLSQSRKLELARQFVGSPEDVPRVAINKSIGVTFSQPRCSFKDAQEERDFLANMQFALSLNSFEFHRHELGRYGIQRCLSYLPDDPMLRFQIAHQLAYNTQVEFRTPTAYQWIRQGILVSLAGIAAKPDQADNYWTAARIIFHKLTSADLASHFASDDDLQTRLRALAGHESVSAVTWGDPWLAAGQLLKKAIDTHAKTGKPASIPLICLHADLSRVQAGYAKSLATQGQFQESQSAWQAVAKQCDFLASQPIIEIDSKKFCLLDLEAARNQQPVDAKLVERLEFEWLRTQLNIQANCARVQQTSHMRNADVAFFKARQALTNQNPQLAHSILASTFEELASEFTDERERLAVVYCVKPEWQLFKSLERSGLDLDSPRSHALQRWQDAVKNLGEIQDQRTWKLVSELP